MKRKWSKLMNRQSDDDEKSSSQEDGEDVDSQQEEKKVENKEVMSNLLREQLELYHYEPKTHDEESNDKPPPLVDADEPMSLEEQEEEEDYSDMPPLEDDDDDPNGGEFVFDDPSFSLQTDRRHEEEEEEPGDYFIRTERGRREFGAYLHYMASVYHDQEKKDVPVEKMSDPSEKMFEGLTRGFFARRNDGTIPMTLDRYIEETTELWNNQRKDDDPDPWNSIPFEVVIHSLSYIDNIATLPLVCNEWRRIVSTTDFRKLWILNHPPLESKYYSCYQAVPKGLWVDHLGQELVGDDLYQGPMWKLLYKSKKPMSERVKMSGCSILVPQGHYSQYCSINSQGRNLYEGQWKLGIKGSGYCPLPDGKGVYYFNKKLSVIGEWFFATFLKGSVMFNQIEIVKIDESMLLPNLNHSPFMKPILCKGKCLLCKDGEWDNYFEGYWIWPNPIIPSTHMCEHISTAVFVKGKLKWNDKIIDAIWNYEGETIKGTVTKLDIDGSIISTEPIEQLGDTFYDNPFKMAILIASQIQRDEIGGIHNAMRIIGRAMGRQDIGDHFDVQMGHRERE